MQLEGAKARRERGLYRGFGGVAGVVVLIAMSVFCMDARAHAVGMSQSVFTVRGALVHAEIVFARGEASALLRSESDDDLRDVVANGIAVTGDGEACAGAFEKGGVVENDGLAIDATFTCLHAPRSLAVTLYLLSELPRGHRHLARIEAGSASSQALLDADHRALALDLASAEVDVPSADNVHSASFTQSVVSTVALGVEHILRGWDHLLFLFALLLVAARLRMILGIITAFTIAHSLTLALAVLGVVRISPSIVEPLIAASIAFVAFDNVAPRHVPRAGIAFIFGLIHGFGFASALDALALSRDRVVASLLGFNVGVEIGQLIVVAILVPILSALRTRGRLGDRVTRPLSIALGAAAIALVAIRLINRPV